MKNNFRPFRLLAALLLIASPLLAHAQADGPRSQVLLPTDVNIVVPTFLHLAGNYNFGGNILVPGADVKSNIFLLTYTRAFDVAGRYAQVIVNPMFGGIDARGTVRHPVTGQPLSLDVSTSGLADALLLFKIGLVNAEPLGLKDYAKQNRTFQMSALFGLNVPIGEYDDDKPLNLGTNVWSLRFGLPMVWPLGTPQSPTFLEVIPSATFYLDNNNPTLGANRRSQDPLFDLQTHLSHNFNPKFWASLDLRYRNGGETTTDGVDDDNRQSVLGGGLSAGYSFSPKLAVQATLGKVLSGDDDSEEDMFRVKIAYTFL